MANEDVKESQPSVKAGAPNPATTDSKKKFVAGMEHLEGSENVKVRVNGPSYTRMDPQTGRVKRYVRNSVVTVTRAELDAVNLAGSRNGALVEVEEEEAS